MTKLLEIPKAYRPNKLAEHGRRFYGDNTEGMINSIPVETRPRGKKYRTQMTFEQLGKDDLGTIFLSMGLDGTFFPKLGGGKFAGLGSVRFVPKSISLIGAKSYHSILTGETMDTEVFIRDCISSAMHSLPPEGRHALEVIRIQLTRGGS